MYKAAVSQFTMQLDSNYKTNEVFCDLSDGYANNDTKQSLSISRSRKSSSFEDSLLDSSLQQNNYTFETQDFNNLQEQNQAEGDFKDDKYIANTNAFKNIVKSFFNFLIDNESQQLILELVSKKPYQQTIKNIKRYIKCYKFNNHNLIKLILSKNYSRILEYYLTFDVTDWIYKSKIANVKTHVQCINFLKDCCVDKSVTQKIQTYSKKY